MVSQTVAWVLTRCGTSVTLRQRNGTEEKTTAVIQPMRQKTEEQHAPTPIGGMDEVRYLYLGMPDSALYARNTQVVWQSRVFDVQSAHPIYVGSEVSHWWATLIPCNEEVAR